MCIFSHHLVCNDADCGDNDADDADGDDDEGDDHDAAMKMTMMMLVMLR